jgi:hypothetical protein
VTIYGQEFVTRYNNLDLKGLYCRFGTLPRVHGTFASSVELTCLSPVSPGAGTVTVEVTNNNQDFSSDAVEYIYQGMGLARCVWKEGAHVVRAMHS